MCIVVVVFHCPIPDPRHTKDSFHTMLTKHILVGSKNAHHHRHHDHNGGWLFLRVIFKWCDNQVVGGGDGQPKCQIIWYLGVLEGRSSISDSLSKKGQKSITNNLTYLFVADAFGRSIRSPTRTQLGLFARPCSSCFLHHLFRSILIGRMDKIIAWLVCYSTTSKGLVLGCKNGKI